MSTLSGRTCLFAGATGDIGKDAIEMLASAGMNVVMTTHDEESAIRIVENCQGLTGEVCWFSNRISEEETLSQIYDRFGSIDVYISKTGSMDLPKSLKEISEESLNSKLQHQITSPFLLIKKVLPYLEKSQAPRIILNTSIGALNGCPIENFADSVARGGVISMTYALSKLLIPQRITVNCIALGGFINDHTPRPGIDLDTSVFLSEVPLGHLGTSREYGGLITYIASEEASFVTGHIFHLTGGMSVGI